MYKKAGRPPSLGEGTYRLPLPQSDNPVPLPNQNPLLDFAESLPQFGRFPITPNTWRRPPMHLPPLPVNTPDAFEAATYTVSCNLNANGVTRFRDSLVAADFSLDSCETIALYFIVAHALQCGVSKPNLHSRLDAATPIARDLVKSWFDLLSDADQLAMIDVIQQFVDAYLGALNAQILH